MQPTALMPPPPRDLRPPALVRPKLIEGPRVQAMTTKRLVIDTKPATENANHTDADLSSPDYTNLLAKGCLFECQFRGTEAPPTSCVFLHGGLAAQGSNGEYALLDGKAIIISEDILIESEFRQGQPVAGARITFITLNQEVHSYSGTVAIQGEQCTIVCAARLIDGVIILTSNGVVKKLGEDNHKPLNTSGNVLFNGDLIRGKWRDGQPDGHMSCQQPTDDSTIIFSGPLVIDKGFFLYHGEGEEVTQFNSGVTRIVKGRWSNGLLVKKTEETKITSYRNTDSTNPPLNGEREYIGTHAKGTFSKPGKLIEGQEITHQENVTTTRIFENRVIIKKIELTRTTGEATIDWPQQEKKYTGLVSDGLPHGEGTMTFSDTSTYKGNFVAGVQCGYGVATFVDKTTYSGNYLNDKRHGFGKVIWAPKEKDKQAGKSSTDHPRAGHSYTGNFYEDKRIGEATYSYPGGRSIKGTWKESQLVAFSTDGGTYTGIFNDQFEQLCGKGKFAAIDGTSYDGKWENGRFVGVVATATEKFQCEGPINGQGQLHGEVFVQREVNGGWSSRKTKEVFENGVLVQRPSAKPVSTPAETPAPAAPLVTSKQKKALPPKQQEPKKICFNYLGIGQFEGYVNGAKSPTGPGTITKDGTVYQCNWNNGQPNNPVTIVDPNGYKYVGEAVMAPLSETKKKREDTYTIQSSGQGAIYAPDGALVCTGEWRHGEPIMLIYPDGSQFSGAVNGKHQPVQGTLTLTDGTIIKGKWPAELTCIYPDKMTYTGQFDNSYRPQGRGEFNWVDSQGRKNSYVGEVDKGQPHGQGINTVGNDYIYKGSFEGNQYHGRGEICDANGEFVCKGEWSQGEPTILTYPGGGQLVDGAVDHVFQPEGPCSMRFEDGIILEGAWSSGKLPVGTLTYPNGIIYAGDFDDKYLPQGHGQFNWVDSQGRKNSYVGDVDKGQTHGQGLHTVDGHHTYQGAFEHGAYHGWGMLVSKEGDTSYEGYFENGKFKPIAATIKVGEVTYRALSNSPADDITALSFYGEKHWGDAGHYTGGLKDGQPYSHGTLVIPDEFTYKGDFFEGRYHGVGEISFANGNVYQGIFADGKINGAGIYSQIDGTTYRAFFTPRAFNTLTFDNAAMLSVREGYQFQGVINQGQPAGYGTLTLLNSGTVFDGVLFKRPN